MKRTVVLCIALGIGCPSAAIAQAARKAPAGVPQPAGNLANALAQRLNEQLHVKTVVGEPVKAGAVTLIPVLLVDVNFAGASVPAASPTSQGLDGFLMSAEARPLGFVAITTKGAQFLPVGNTAK